MGHMTPRRNTPIRFTPEGLEAADAVAAAQFEGNRSQAIRRLLALGLAAWAAGCRTVEEVGRKR